MYQLSNKKQYEDFDYFNRLGIVKLNKDKTAFCFISNDYQILNKDNINKEFFLDRDRFSHKGSFGHCFLVGGSYGKAGAVVLSAKASMRTGCGLLTIHIPKLLYNIIQTSFAEAMVDIDNDDEVFSCFNSLEKYSCVAIGCGLNTKEKTKQALISFLKTNNKPIVIDADALNILSSTENFISLLKPNTILTPHPKEFERLFGTFNNDREKMLFIKDLSQRIGITIVLKGAITIISTKTGKVFFNIEGNPGMATAGSGDVLTGIILGILSQGFSIEESAKIGVLIHAMAGDCAKEEFGEKSLIASDIINNIYKAIRILS
ncbi:MAG: NAD(P)H-hydrate dehydratase [Bacteroidales bacterium]|nr:NAD(P)H-hydrate dehydratase [Bacteroidales bacterium]